MSNNANPQNVAQPAAPEEEQGAGYGRYILYFFIGFFLLKMFAQPASNHPKIRNILGEGDLYDISFYLSNKTFLEADDLNKLASVFTIENMTYSNSAYLSPHFNTSKEYTLNFTYEESNKLNDNLFLFSYVKVKDSKKEIFMRKLFNNMVYVDKIKILKKVERLSNKIREIEMNNDVVSENTTEHNYSDENYVKDLYYIPEVYLYMISYPNEEDPVTFEELRIMGVTSYVDYKQNRFLPKTYLTDFWTLLRELRTVKKGENEIKISINFKYLSNFYFKFMRGVEFNSETMENNFSIPGVKDNFVELLKYNSIQYLALIFTVNILHTVFSFLGFANDITYYKNLKNLDGLYTKYLYYNLFHYLIAFIYFYIESASYIVMIELFVAAAIELWKFRKIFKIDISMNNKYIIKIDYAIEFKRDISKDYEDEAVSVAMKFLFLPISVFYLSYRIYNYKAGKTIFKFIIEYIFFLLNMFGFVLLTPQVYLNYKMQSVEHLPIKVLSYKFLNTIIDDLFAFAVDTPTLYRISVFKDDVIFVIYIYQMIKYRNNKRVDFEPKEEPKQLPIEETKQLEDDSKIENTIETTTEASVLDPKTKKTQ